MTPAQKVLLALDANDCWPSARARVEDVVFAQKGGATFGTVGGQQSVAELQDLLTLWAGRMQNLDTWYGQASPIWVGKDSTAFISFTNDWNALHARYDAALKGANAAVTAARLSFATPNAMIPAQQQYNGLMKAMRQCAPPDGCPVVKGDWADLYSRAAAVSSFLGIAPPPDAPTQPVAVDLDQSLFAATAPIDIVAQATGAQKAGPLGPSALSWLAWVGKHKKLLLVGGVVLAGGVVLTYVAPALGLAAKGVKGIAALAA